MRHWWVIAWVALSVFQLQFNFPERVSKVVVVGSPMVGSSLSPLLKLLGLAPGWLHAFQYDGIVPGRHASCILLLYARTRAFRI